MGRKKIEKELRRSIVIKVRLTPDEKRRVDEMAELADLNRSEILRLGVKFAYDTLFSS